MGKVGAVSETKDFAKVIDVPESEGVSRDEETEENSCTSSRGCGGGGSRGSTSSK